MKKVAILGSFALVAVTASTSFAGAPYTPTGWRCAADVLIGHPSFANLIPSQNESRTGYGRQKWAKGASTIALFGPGGKLLSQRLWDNTTDPTTGVGIMDSEVASAATQDIDLYPVYQDTDPNVSTGIWVGPGPNAAAPYNASTYTGISSITTKTLPKTTISIVGLCEAGCYAPEQEVRFGDRTIPVAKAYESGEREVTTLAPNATFGALNFIVNDIARWTVDIAPAKQKLITLHMKSGGELRVTTEHPVLTSEGVLKKAMNLVVGESLVKEDGSPDPIATIEQHMVFTKVYNLRPVTTDLTSNILVAQGYLNGSVRYQGEWVEYLNRVLLRHTIPADIIPRGGAAKAGKASGTTVAVDLNATPSEPRQK